MGEAALEPGVSTSVLGCGLVGDTLEAGELGSRFMGGRVVVPSECDLSLGSPLAMCLSNMFLASATPGSRWMSIQGMGFAMQSNKVPMD